VQRRPRRTPNAEPPSLCQSSGNAVPLEHANVPAEDTPPRDWSQLGRRVLAEAWRRLMDEQMPCRPTATPVAQAPSPLEVHP